MKTRKTELLKARRELGDFLDQVSPVAIDHELNELLAEMNRSEALGFRWDEVDGLPTRVWYPLSPDAYAHRIFQMEHVLGAIAELFLTGDLEFLPHMGPPLAILWLVKPTARVRNRTM